MRTNERANENGMWVLVGSIERSRAFLLLKLRARLLLLLTSASAAVAAATTDAGAAVATSAVIVYRPTQKENEDKKERG